MGSELAGTPYDQSGVLSPPAEAVGLSAIRGLSNGAMRQYTAVEFERGWRGVEHMVRTFWALGYVRTSTGHDDGYAVLDVLDANGDIIADYDVPTSDAFAFIKKKLGLAVVDVAAAVALVQGSRTTGSKLSSGGGS